MDNMDTRRIDFKGIIVDKDVVRKEWIKKRKQEDRQEVRTRRKKFFLEAWDADFPGYDYINYDALLELANRSEKVGKWMAGKNAEFTALLTFPDWAAEGTTEEERAMLQDSFTEINKVNRETAEMKMKLSKKMRRISSNIDQLHDSRLAKAYKNSVAAFILTYPKNQLPIHLMLSIVRFTDDFNTWKETNPDTPLGDKVLPSDYENNLLDAFRKTLWSKYKEGADIEQELKLLGVDFYIPTTSVAPDLLSHITKNIE